MAPPQGNNSVPDYMPPVQGVCFHCDSYMGPFDRPFSSLSTLDLTQLVTAGVIPASSLRLVPQMAALQHLRVLKASGFPMQGMTLGACLDSHAAPHCHCESFTVSTPACGTGMCHCVWRKV